MKNYKILILIFITNIILSQNSFPPNGVVKLDTNLNIGNQVSSNGEGQIPRLSLQPYRHTGGLWDFKSRDNSSVAFLDINYGNWGTALTLTSDTNVGIGTLTPSSKLSVLGSFSKLTLIGIDGVYDNLIKYGYKADLESQTSYVNRWHGIDATITAGDASSNKLKFRLYAGSTANLAPIDVMTLTGNGNVGIGTSSPSNKLDVNGTIHSQQVKVDMNGWSDFVFKKEYKLPTLEEVEKHIVEKGHLENISSEAEVLKDGINLGEMNAKLLQKIEELTLYIIEMKKDNQVTKDKLQKIEKKIGTSN